MSSRRVGGIDLDTGEILDGVMVMVGRKVRRHPYGKRFVVTNQEALEALAKDPDMTGQTYRVFLYLCSRLDFDNFMQVPQTEIAEELKIGKTKVSPAIALLTAKGVLIQGPKVGRSSVFRLNPQYGWKGKTADLHKEREKRLRVVRSPSDQAERDQ
jgi:DNA-binding MarR family transcriptional regulator